MGNTIYDLQRKMGKGSALTSAAAFAPEHSTSAHDQSTELLQFSGSNGSAAVQETAAEGLKGSSGPLPYTQQIQQSFGHHDVSGIQAHTGKDAKAATDTMGARAYASGDQIALGDRGKDLHTTAHEAAHVIQQRGGVQLKGGVGSAGDVYEKNADAVADRVVQGKSAVDLLDGFGAGGGQSAVQFQKGPPPNPKIDKAIKILADKLNQTYLDPKHSVAAVEAVLVTIAPLTDDELAQVAAKMNSAQTSQIIEHAKPGRKAVVEKIKNARVVDTMKGLTGKLYWAGGSGPDGSGKIKKTSDRPNDAKIAMETNTNEFAVWIRGGKAPNDTSKMNCWEACLYSAHKAGVIKKPWLVKIHDDAAKSGNYHDSLGKAMGVDTAKKLTKTDKPKGGDLVFMDGLAHVVLALGTQDSAGRHQVLSLWILPGSGGKFVSTVQKTTIEQINGAWKTETGNPNMDVTYARNPW